MGVLDLLFRWSTLRIAEANTQVGGLAWDIAEC